MRTVGLGTEKKGMPDKEEFLEKIAELEKENAALRDEVDSLKKKSKSSAEKKAKAEPDSEKE